MTTTMARSRGLRLLLPLLVLAMTMAACASGGASIDTVGAPIGEQVGNESGGMSYPAASEAPAAAPDDAGGALPGDGGEAPLSAPLRDDLKVVYTGSLELVVGDLPAALAAAKAAVLATGGYIGASQERNDAERSVATITYRIPAERWDETIESLRGLATEVVGGQTQATEVGGQIVDLEARLRNLRTSEAVLVEIAGGTGKVTDLLEVQARITDVRGEIERIDAQRAQLEDQAAYGTLVTTFGLEIVQVQETAKGWDPASDVDAATATLIEAGQSIVSAGIWFGIVWLPVILVLVVIALVARWAIRRFLPKATPMGPVAGWGGGEG